MDEDKKYKIVDAEFDVKIYIQDEQRIGFWKAVSDDNWKTGCLGKNETTGLATIKVLICVLLERP